MCTDVQEKIPVIKEIFDQFQQLFPDKSAIDMSPTQKPELSLFDCTEKIPSKCE